MKNHCSILLTFAFNILFVGFCYCQNNLFDDKVFSKMTGWQGTTKDGYLYASYDSFEGTIRGIAFRAESGSKVSYQYRCQMDSGQLNLSLIQSNGDIIWNDKIDAAVSNNNLRDISISIADTDKYRIVVTGDSKKGRLEIHHDK